MQYFSLVLLSCLAVVSIGANPPVKKDDNVCLFNKQCELAHGNACFCFKPNHEYYGSCICNMDLGCLTHDDCKGKGRPHQVCSCVENNGRGECRCDGPLYSPRS